LNPDPPATVTHELIIQGGTLFQHSNLRLPLPAERAISYALVAPRARTPRGRNIRAAIPNSRRGVLDYSGHLLEGIPGRETGESGLAAT